jgi:glutamate synthase domain-containing protein 3
MSNKNSITIDAAGVYYKQLNDKLRQVVADGAKEINISNVNGQRYIGTDLVSDVKINVHGTPGSDLAAFMDGPTINVFGNAQDGVANTMNEGEIVIHGDCGDIAGFAMRGGRLFIKGDAGYRVGIHMKSYKEKIPVLVVGGIAHDFLGEYMAGGILIVLGLGSEDKKEFLDGGYIGTGMHGGVIYLRGKVDEHQLGKEVSILKLDENDKALLKKHLTDFSKYFNYDLKKILEKEFIKLLPLSHRPYGKLYAY